VVGRNGELAVPPVRPSGVADKRPQALGTVGEIGEGGRSLKRPKPAPTPHQQAVGLVDAIVDRDGLMFVKHLSSGQDPPRDGVRKWTARHDAAEHRHEAAPQARPEIVGIAVRRDHHPLGRDGATRSLDPPARALRGEADRAGLAVDRGAGPDRRIREPARKAEWIDGAATAVERAAAVAGAARYGGHTVCVENLDRRAAALQALRGPPQEHD